jgi:uncharacterized protein DUF5317
VSFLGLVVLVAALVPLVTGGSYRRLALAPWRWGGLLALGLGLQLVLDTGLIPHSRWHDLGFGILVASYVLLVGFCSGNALVRGMSVVLIGVALNGFVITIDQGMPVRIPADWRRGRVEATVKHHPRVPGDHLLALTDIITLRRLDSVVSFGDLIIAFGLVDVTYRASRRSRRSRPGSRTGSRTQPPEQFSEVHADATTPVSVDAAVGVNGHQREDQPRRTRPSRSRIRSSASSAREL